MQVFKGNIHFLRCWKSYQLGVLQDKFPCRTWARGDLQIFVFNVESFWTISRCNHSNEQILFSLLHVQRYRNQAVQLVCPIQGVIQASLDLLQILKYRLLMAKGSAYAYGIKHHVLMHLEY
jgi:hypothetical protein